MINPPVIRRARFLVPLLVGASLIGTFYVGQFVGASDEHKKSELIADRLAVYRGVDDIKRLGLLSDLLRDGRTSDLERALNLSVRIQAGAAKKCFADPVCTSFQLGSEARAVELRRTLAAAGVTE